MNCDHSTHSTVIILYCVYTFIWYLSIMFTELGSICMLSNDNITHMLLVNDYVIFESVYEPCRSLTK